MRRRLFCLAFLLLAALGLVACARAVLPTAGPADVQRATARWPGTSEAELARGRQLYQGHCASCHLPVMPHVVPADEWPMHVGEMKERAHLSEHEAELVTRYLVTMSTARVVR
jgi:mono/diheme cytochrome c family protein